MINSNFVQKYFLFLISKITFVIFIFVDNEDFNDNLFKNYFSFTFRVNNYQKIIILNVSYLSHENIFLKLNWLKKHNFNVDWKNHKLIFHSFQYKRYCNIKKFFYAQAITSFSFFIFLNIFSTSNVVNISMLTSRFQILHIIFIKSNSHQKKIVILFEITLCYSKILISSSNQKKMIEFSEIKSSSNQN